LACIHLDRTRLIANVLHLIDRMRLGDRAGSR
jgi:hypothetical protein